MHKQFSCLIHKCTFNLELYTYNNSSPVIQNQLELVLGFVFISGWGSGGGGLMDEIYTVIITTKHFKFPCSCTNFHINKYCHILYLLVRTTAFYVL